MEHPEHGIVGTVLDEIANMSEEEIEYFLDEHGCDPGFLVLKDAIEAAALGREARRALRHLSDSDMKKVGLESRDTAKQIQERGERAAELIDKYRGERQLIQRLQEAGFGPAE